MRPQRRSRRTARARRCLYARGPQPILPVVGPPPAACRDRRRLRPRGRSILIEGSLS